MALKNLPGTDEPVKYESGLNLPTPKHSCPLICMYDVNSFSENSITGILLAHPYVVRTVRSMKTHITLSLASPACGNSDYKTMRPICLAGEV